MPTKRRRHAITETPPVKEALDELRDELDKQRLELSELVILGAREKLSQLRAHRARGGQLRRRLADRVRNGDLPLEVEAADAVRRRGWSRD